MSTVGHARAVPRADARWCRSRARGDPGVPRPRHDRGATRESPRRSGTRSRPIHRARPCRDRARARPRRRALRQGWRAGGPAARRIAASARARRGSREKPSTLTVPDESPIGQPDQAARSPSRDFASGSTGTTTTGSWPRPSAGRSRIDRGRRRGRPAGSFWKRIGPLSRRGSSKPAPPSPYRCGARLHRGACRRARDIASRCARASDRA